MSGALGFTKCAECGMPTTLGEYHPYAACIMYKYTHQSDKVQSWLQAVEQHGYEKAQAELEQLRARLERAEEQVAAVRAYANECREDAAMPYGEELNKVYAQTLQGVANILDEILNAAALSERE